MTADAMKEPLLGGDAPASPSASSATLLGNTTTFMSEKSALEPQNALTRKFTEQEWVALRKLRARLPEVYTAAYGPPTGEAAPEPLTFSIWGIQVNVAEPQSDPRVSVVLMKFLRAKDLNVDEAQKMLVNTLRWRRQVAIDLLGEADSKHGKKLNSTFGHDKDGLPVFYTKAVFIDWELFRSDRYLAANRHIRNTEYIFRNVLDFDTTEHIAKVIDMKDATTGNIPADAVAELKSITDKHYPGFMAYSIIINTPPTANWLLRFGRWLDSVADTASKSAHNRIQVGMDKNEIARALLARIDAKQLPQELGGEAPGFSWPHPSTKT